MHQSGRKIYVCKVILSLYRVSEPNVITNSLYAVELQQSGVSAGIIDAVKNCGHATPSVNSRTYHDAHLIN